MASRHLVPFMNGLRVLISNLALLGRSGTEMYVRDLALGLSRRGHVPVVYAPRLGSTAQGLKAAGVIVTDRLSSVHPAPDLIHGHHNLPTMAALLHFMGIPAVFVCHDRTAWHDAPPRFSRIRRYAAVDHYCLDRLVKDHSIPAERTQVVLNSVDLERFKPRKPLPKLPRRALLFSNQANQYTHLNPVREACQRTSLELDVIGSGVDNVCEHPESVLGEYDLVFAKARCALEALATGAAVVLCGSEGSGPIVTYGRLEELRRFNFGRSVLNEPLAPELLAQQIKSYDAAEASRVSARIRKEASLETMISQWLQIYESVLAESADVAPSMPDDESRAAAAFLCSLEPHLFGQAVELNRMLHERNYLMLQLEAREASRSGPRDEIGELQTTLEPGKPVPFWRHFSDKLKQQWVQWRDKLN